MGEVKRVIIHGGKAHRDEFLSLGLVLHARLITETTPVQRGTPTVEELDDPEILVLDCGRRHEPELLNFDHHQFPKGVTESTLSLLATHLVHKNGETYAQLLSEMQWFKSSVIQDAHGPMSLARHLGFKDFPQGLASPVEYGVLRFLSFFGDSSIDSLPTGLRHLASEKHVPKSLKHLAHTIMFILVSDAIKMRERLKELEQAKLFQIKEGTYAILFNGSPFGIRTFAERNKLNLSVAVTLDDRGKGWVLQRLRDDDPIDFSTVEDDRLSFKHQNGFLAVTKELLDWREVQELCKRALK